MRMSIAAITGIAQAANRMAVEFSLSGTGYSLDPRPLWKLPHMAKAPPYEGVALCLSLDAIQTGCLGHWPPKILEP
jgi:hypothetical protein